MSERWSLPGAWFPHTSNTPVRAAPVPLCLVNGSCFVRGIGAQKSAFKAHFEGKIYAYRTLHRNRKGGSRPSTRHTLQFELPVAAATVADQRNPDKQKLKETILALREMGWSYRQIGREVGLYWTRVGQILRNMARD